MMKCFDGSKNDPRIIAGERARKEWADMKRATARIYAYRAADGDCMLASHLRQKLGPTEAECREVFRCAFEAAHIAEFGEPSCYWNNEEQESA